MTPIKQEKRIKARVEGREEKGKEEEGRTGGVLLPGEMFFFISCKCVQAQLENTHRRTHATHTIEHKDKHHIITLIQSFMKADV